MFFLQVYQEGVVRLSMNCFLQVYQEGVVRLSMNCFLQVYQEDVVRLSMNWFLQVYQESVVRLSMNCFLQVYQESVVRLSMNCFLQVYQESVVRLSMNWFFLQVKKPNSSTYVFMKSMGYVNRTINNILRKTTLVIKKTNRCRRRCRPKSYREKSELLAFWLSRN